MATEDKCQNSGHYKSQHFFKIGEVNSEVGYSSFCKFCKCKQFEED